MTKLEEGEPTWELVLLCVNVAIFCGYHIYLFLVIWLYPLSTAAGQNDAIRKIWCQHVQQQGKDVLVIQTLRNSMMSSSLLATTSLTLSTLIAAFFIRTEGITRIEQLSESSANLLSVVHKLFAMVILFIISFICYMQSIRGDNHAGFMLTIPKNLTGNLVTTQSVTSLLFKASLYHTIGTRFFYAAFLSVIFLFGIIPLTASTIALTILLFATDSCKDNSKEMLAKTSPSIDHDDLLDKVVYT